MKITFDTEELIPRLASFTDVYLCSLWHIAQSNPCDMSERDAGDFAEQVGREIIRRFISQTGPELWAHQGRHAEFCELLAIKQGREA